MPPKLKKKKQIRSTGNPPVDKSVYKPPDITRKAATNLNNMSLPSAGVTIFDKPDSSQDVEVMTEDFDDIEIIEEDIDDVLDDPEYESYVIDSILLPRTTLAPALLRTTVSQNDVLSRPKESHRDAIFVEKFCPVIGLNMKVNHSKDRDLHNMKWVIDDVDLKAHYMHESVPYLPSSEFGIDPQFAVMINESMLRYFTLKYNGDIWLIFHLMFREDVLEGEIRVSKMSGVWIVHASSLSMENTAGFVDYISPVTDEYGVSDGAYLFDVSEFPCYTINYAGMPFRVNKWE